MNNTLNSYPVSSPLITVPADANASTPETALHPSTPPFAQHICRQQCIHGNSLLNSQYRYRHHNIDNKMSSWQGLITDRCPAPCA